MIIIQFDADKRWAAVCEVSKFPPVICWFLTHIYDYQGRMSVEGLSEFVTYEIFLKKSKARRIYHVTSAQENLEIALTEIL